VGGLVGTGSPFKGGASISCVAAKEKTTILGNGGCDVTSQASVMPFLVDNGQPLSLLCCPCSSHIEGACFACALLCGVGRAQTLHSSLQPRRQAGKPKVASRFFNEGEKNKNKKKTKRPIGRLGATACGVEGRSHHRARTAPQPYNAPVCRARGGRPHAASKCRSEAAHTTTFMGAKSSTNRVWQQRKKLLHHDGQKEKRARPLRLAQAPRTPPPHPPTQDTQGYTTTTRTDTQQGRHRTHTQATDGQPTAVRFRNAELGSPDHEEKKSPSLA
jgi:hypothetical protein